MSARQRIFQIYLSLCHLVATLKSTSLFFLGALEPKLLQLECRNTFVITLKCTGQMLKKWSFDNLEKHFICYNF